MSWECPPGARIDLEVRAVKESDGSLVNVYSMTYEVFDPSTGITGAALSTGEATWEAEGVYLVSPTMPAAATIGSVYLVLVTVTVTSGGAVEKLLIPVRVGGPTL